MSKNNNNGKIKVEHRVTKLEGCVVSIQEDISEIKVDVRNHIPSLIRGLNDKIDSNREMLNKRPTWLMSAIVGALLLLLGVVIGFLGV